MNIALSTVALLLIFIGSQWLYAGANRLAVIARGRAAILAVFFLAFATGAPEILIGARATLSENLDLALGIAIGSPIINATLMLGLSVWMMPIQPTTPLMRVTLLYLIASLCCVLLSLQDGVLDRSDGATFLGLLVLYVVVSQIIVAKNYHPRALAENNRPSRSTDGWRPNTALILIGIALIGLGSVWLIDSVINIAWQIGMSHYAAGLTLVCFATACPELVVVAAAARRKEYYNVERVLASSSIFSLLGVLSVVSLLTPGGAPVPRELVDFDLPLAIVASLAMLPQRYLTRKNARVTALALMIAYGAYAAHLLVHENHPTESHDPVTALFYVLLPIGAIVLGWTMTSLLPRRRLHSSTST